MTQTNKSGKVAYVFPGQGSQYVGMGHDLYRNYPAARSVFDEADKALGFSLSQLCFAGPQEKLSLTSNAQPAILTVSLAYLKAFIENSKRAKALQPDFVAGHSLGEYTALVASGVVGLSEAVSIVHERGRLMHEAGDMVPGSMVAVLGIEEAVLRPLCVETGAEIANINCPGQIVLSGSKEAVAAVVERIKALGAGRCIFLEVSGAFHSSLMQPVVEGIAKVITPLPFNEPVIPVVANAVARPLASSEEVKAELILQLCTCVQWQRSVEYMAAAGVSTFVEVGPGKVLSGLIKRISPQAQVLSLDKPEMWE